MSDDGIRKVAELVKDARIAMFTTTNAQGQLVSRPMDLQEIEFDGDLWFFADQRSDAVEEILAKSGVNVSFSSGSAWVSVTGEAEVVRDRARTRSCGTPSSRRGSPTGRARRASCSSRCARMPRSTGMPPAARPCSCWAW